MGCCFSKKKLRKMSLKHQASGIRFSINKRNFVHLVKGSVNETYKIERKIGDGGFGIVKLATHKASNTKRAIKSIRLSQNVDLDKLMIEVNILKNLDHPNIVKVYEVIQDSVNLNIVMEYCSGGELFDKIKEKGGFSENLAAKYMLNIVSAIRYCHNNKIVHRDLKPENILFESPQDDARLKIIDFGTSQYFTPLEKMKKFIGTSYYVAPEVIGKDYDEKCDVWSLGVILFILLSGYPPFYAKNETDIYEKIKKAPVSFNTEAWSTVSEEAKKLIQKMLKKNPSARISIEEVYSDPWLQNRANDRVPDKPITKLALENLSHFGAENQLQRITLNYIVDQLISNEEIEGLRKFFELIDRNGDGRLSKDEIALCIPRFAEQFDLDLEEIMNACDTDGNGYLEYTEFLTATVNWKSALNNERLIAAFKVYDKDGDGKISLQELKETLGNSGLDEKYFSDMINFADKNNDGEIDFQEFKQIMKIKNKDDNRI